MKAKTSIIYFFFGMLIFTFACKKEEGYGGNSNIKGLLIEKVYNDDYSQMIYEQKAIDEDVYIIFENAKGISDKVTTDFEGRFIFEDLFPGNYQVYYYSDNSASAYGEEKEAKIDIELKKNETLDLGELIKMNSMAYNEGSAGIKGKVFLINYLNSSSYPHLIVKDTSLALDQEIYLIYGNHPTYDDRIRTNYDGTFYFDHLIKGDYKVFLYSEDVKGGTEDIVILKEAKISNEFDEIDLGNIYIEQL